MTSTQSTTQPNNSLIPKDNSLPQLQEKPFHIDRGIRWIIFILFFILNTVLNIDHGIVPAANDEIKESLGLAKEDNTTMGLFNSLVFLGLTFGSLISACIINRFNRKYTLIINLFLCGICLFFFGFCNEIVLYFNRVVIGIFHSFISIYPPVWCNQFGIKDKKTIMIALLQIGPPLGVVLGYGLTILCGKIFNTEQEEVNTAWKYAFMIQAIAIWGVMGIFICFRNRFFSEKYQRVPDEQLMPQFAPTTILSLMKTYPRASSFFYENEKHDDNNNINTEPNTQNKEDKATLQNDKSKKEEQSIISEKTENSANEEEKDTNNNNMNESDNTNNEDIKEDNETNEETKDNIKSEILLSFPKNKKPKIKKVNYTCFIIKQPVFLLCVYTLSTIFYILTAIQYECRSYLETALNITNENQRFFAFSIVCLTSPTSGILLGSGFVNYKGGYETKQSILYCLLFGVISLLCSIPVPFVNTLLEFTIWLWLVFFFGGALVTPLVGIIMTSLSKELSSTANSINVMVCNLIGFLPAPFVYGWVQNQTQFLDVSYNKRIPMMVSLWYAGLGILALGIAAIIRYVNYDKMYKTSQVVLSDNNETQKDEQKSDDKEHINIEHCDKEQKVNDNDNENGSVENDHPLIPNDY